MEFLHTSKARAFALGSWLAQDPRRLTVVFTFMTVLATALAIATGFAQPGILVGPNGTGDSGGG